MANRTVTCSFCGEKFQVDEASTKAFCTHCGAENQIQSKPLYEELDGLMEPRQRRDRLLDYADQHPEDAEAALLAKIFELRYVQHGKSVYDAFLRVWFDMIIYSRKRTKRLELKMITNELKDFFADDPLVQFRASGPEAEALFWQEMTHAVALYFYSSRDDKKYTTMLFNLRKMNVTDVTKKAAAEAVEAGVALLALLEQTEDYARLGDLSREAFLKAYPEGLPAYNEALNKWKESDEARALQKE